MPGPLGALRSRLRATALSERGTLSERDPERLEDRPRRLDDVRLGMPPSPPSELDARWSTAARRDHRPRDATAVGGDPRLGRRRATTCSSTKSGRRDRARRDQRSASANGEPRARPVPTAPTRPHHADRGVAARSTTSWRVLQRRPVRDRARGREHEPAPRPRVSTARSSTTSSVAASVSSAADLRECRADDLRASARSWPLSRDFVPGRYRAGAVVGADDRSRSGAGRGTRPRSTPIAVGGRGVDRAVGVPMAQVALAVGAHRQPGDHSAIVATAEPRAARRQPRRRPRARPPTSRARRADARGHRVGADLPGVVGSRHGHSDRGQPAELEERAERQRAPTGARRPVTSRSTTSSTSATTAARAPAIGDIDARDDVRVRRERARPAATGVGHAGVRRRAARRPDGDATLRRAQQRRRDQRGDRRVPLSRPRGARRRARAMNSRIRHRQRRSPRSAGGDAAPTVVPRTAAPTRGPAPAMAVFDRARRPRRTTAVLDCLTAR